MGVCMLAYFGLADVPFLLFDARMPACLVTHLLTPPSDGGVGGPFGADA